MGGRFLHRMRDDHTTRICYRLQARRDVDTVAIDAAVWFFDDVTQMDSNAKAQLQVLRDAFGQTCEFRLSRGRSAHCAVRRIEDCQHGIAGGVNNSTALGLGL